jgi:hypothetical protein
VSTFGLEYNALTAGAQDWRDLAELMTDTSRGLADQPTSAIPASAQDAAASFLSAWSGFAGESAEIATGFAGALDATRSSYRSADDATDQRFAHLDGRLGPRR